MAVRKLSHASHSLLPDLQGNFIVAWRLSKSNRNSQLSTGEQKIPPIAGGKKVMKINKYPTEYTDFLDRIGLAFCRLNRWEWDELLGPKPEGFDDLPDYDSRKLQRFRRPMRTKDTYISPAIITMESILGPANTSRYWWKYALGKTDEEWIEWYVQGLFKAR